MTTTKEVMIQIVDAMKHLEASIYKYIDARLDDLEIRIIEGTLKKRQKPVVMTKEIAVAQAPVEVQLTPTKAVMLKPELLASWADTYPQEFLQDELKKARNWMLSNSEKAPKSRYDRFLNTWFQRAWEKHRLTLKGNPVKLTAEDVAKILGGKGA